jgi:hypothetical protein
LSPSYLVLVPTPSFLLSTSWSIDTMAGAGAAILTIERENLWSRKQSTEAGGTWVSSTP